MPEKVPTGMDRFNLTLPTATLDWFRQQAEREGVTMQSLMAPVLNAVARGEIRGGWEICPEPHGNSLVGRVERKKAQRPFLSL